MALGGAEMNGIDQKRKINFIKSFWLEMLKINVYTYEENKLSNFNTYLIELLNLFQSIKLQNGNFIYKHKFGLYHLLVEFRSYLNKNVYFVKQYDENGSISMLKRKINKVINAKENQNVKMQIKELESLSNMLKSGQENNIKNLFNELIRYIYSPIYLEESYKTAKSLTMDLIVELILDGYPVEFLEKEVYKENIFDQQIKENQPLSLKQQFEIKREMFVESNKKKKHTFIFRVDNLKTIYPFTIQGFTFYNPLREDINLHLKNLKTLNAEEGLMRREEVDYLKDKKPISKRERTDYDIVKYTDAHVRVDIFHWSKVKAELEIRDKLEKIISGLRFAYNISNLKTSKSKVYISGVKRSYPLWRDERKNDKYLSTSYRDVNIFNDKYKELEDENNLIYKMLRTNENSQTHLFYSIKSFHLGLDDLSIINKFHHFWVSLESLLADKEVGNIKHQIIQKFSEHLVYYYYYFELINIFNRVFDQFYRYYTDKNSHKIDFPKDIQEINNLGDFYNSINLKAFSENLNVFIKYLKDEYLIYRIKSYIKLNEGDDYRVKFNTNLKKHYQQKLSKIYSLRNQMFHNGINDNSMLIFYTDWLESLLYAIFGTLKNNINDGNADSINGSINIKYEEFTNYLKRNGIQIIEYYFSEE